MVAPLKLCLLKGDTIFVHAEENLESLEPLEKAPLVDVPEDFKGLTSFDVDFLEVNGRFC